MTKRTLTVALMSAVAYAHAVFAAGEAEIQSMRGLKALKVVVEDVADNVSKLGLTQHAMRTIAQAHLQQQFHIELDEGARVFLYIKCRAVGPYRGTVAYDLSVQLRQMVVLLRDRDAHLVVATWQESGTFLTSQRKFAHSVRTQLQDFLDKFGYDFLKANAK